MDVTPRCPSCDRALRRIEATNNPLGATRVYRRTCRHCAETWQIVARPPLVVEGLRIDKLDLTFAGHREGNR